MFTVKIIVSSTRPGRKGPAVASWINQLCTQRGDMNIEVLDLAVINLPFMDEAEHPRFRKYAHEHTKKWSRAIDEADAFIFVTAEYNYGYPAPLKNALDFLYQEWTYKAAAFVSYGGIAGGTRAVQQLKQVVTAQKMMPIAESVNIPFFTKYINDQGEFIPGEGLIKPANDMINELLKWTEKLAEMRNKNK